MNGNVNCTPTNISTVRSHIILTVNQSLITIHTESQLMSLIPHMQKIDIVLKDSFSVENKRMYYKENKTKQKQ